MARSARDNGKHVVKSAADGGKGTDSQGESWWKPRRRGRGRGGIDIGGGVHADE